jgi:uncharacterized protein (DUF983 family)
MRVDPAPTRFTTMAAEDLPRRPALPAMLRGLRRRCPNCGRGRLMARYLKVVPNCPVCGEDLSHHRADDAPPYLTIVVVGHIIVPLILFVETHWPLPTAAHLAIWLPLTLILSLALLPAMKGAVVGLQWALRMHGFDKSDGSRPLPDDGFAEAVGGDDWGRGP